jgi:hypothetical protein
VAYPEVHNQVLPVPTALYIPEELERRRLQNGAEEKIADKEAKQLREDPAAPEENDYIARCMQLLSAKPDSEQATEPKKRAYEDISDASTQDEESVEEPESPTQSKSASNGTDEMEKVDQDKPTQSDCMSIDYSLYTVEDPEERAGTMPVPPLGNDQWGNQSGGSNPDPVKTEEHRWLLHWMTGLDQESRDTDPEPVDLFQCPRTWKTPLQNNWRLCCQLRQSC